MPRMRFKNIAVICIIVGVSLALYKWKYIDVNSLYGKYIQTSEQATHARNSKEAASNGTLHSWQSRKNIQTSEQATYARNSKEAASNGTLHSWQSRKNIKTSEQTTHARNSKESTSNGTLHSWQSKSDVLINGYMRSGSSLIGRLLGHREDTFYWYEPLYKHSLRWQYLRGDNQLCQTLTPSCTNDTGLLDSSLRMLSGIYNCSFYSDHWESIADEMHPQKSVGGPTWQTYLNCRHQQRSSQERCLKEMTPSCRSHTHRVTKVLRLTIDNAAKLLNNNPRLKIVHLFRDPRGIINSHIHTGWFNMSRVKATTDLIQNDVRALCERMLFDIERGKQLLQQFPGRIRFIQYEDLDQQTMIAKVLKLYKFLEMSHNDGYNESFLEELTENKKGKHPFMYRTGLSWDVVQLIDRQCSDIYNLLGYVKFQSDEELKNMSIPAIKRPLPYTIA